MPAPNRILSIDQYRGYAVFGMILVNFVGRFEQMPWHVKHHSEWMSYADTIAPLFMFVVGMGFRLSLQARVKRDGARSALLGAARRYFVLVLIGFVIYGVSQWPHVWDALVDIGFAGLLALPVMLASKTARAVTALLYLALYQSLFICAGYGEWTMHNSINGGPLGPLSWAAVLLFGTIAFDIAQQHRGRQLVLRFILWAAVLSVAGWALHFEWPGLKEHWNFSQKAMTAPYPLFATGLCFLMYLPFYYINDVRRIELPHLTALGMNALVIYILQQVLGEVFEQAFISRDAAVPMALAWFLLFYSICYGVAWWLKRRDIVVKV